jgi:hypothetical protein
MLQLNIWCSWWWAYVPETCRAKNTLIKLPYCIKLAFQIINSYFVHCFVCGTCLPILREGYIESPRTDYFCLFQTRFKKSHHKSKALSNK